MNPLDFLENEELLRFLRHHKTEISCMENPHTFVSQLRDYNLIPEAKYKSIMRMKSKEKLKKNVYDVLDWVETEQSECINAFWRCVFNNTIMNQYPKLRELHRSLMDGSFHFGFQLPEKLENEKKDQEKSREPSQDEERGERNISLVKKKKSRKRKERDDSVCDNTEDEERPGPSCPVTRARKWKSTKNSSSSSQKKKNDIWTWPIYKIQFPVTCGDQEGILIPDRLARGEKCIVVDKQWFTPPEFERFAGKHSYKNWKMSIRCKDTPLVKLIEEGHLKYQWYKGGHKKAQKTLFPPADSSTDSDVENRESDQDDQASANTRQSSPGSTDEEEERGEQNGQQTQISQDNGEPLSALIEENQKNKECCFCKRETEKLVECDECPRSFHQTCHLPHLEDAICGDGSQWICTFCVFRINQQLYYRNELTMEATMARDMSQHMLECQYLFMRLCCANEIQAFTLNPCLYLQDYSNVIETPMWLDRIADKLQRRLYKTVGEFVSDVRLIFTNCAVYKRETAEIQEEAKRLQMLFDEDFKDVFNISS